MLLFTTSRIIYSEKQRNETKKMVQFKLEDTIFFQDDKGHLHQLQIHALDEDIISADGATLKLYHHKNG